MGSLVNPIGWRVKSTRYWKSNLLVNNHSFMFSYHLQRQLYEIIGSLLRYLTVKDKNAGLSLFDLLSYNLHTQNGLLTVFVRLRFFTTQLWKSLFEKKQGIRYLKPKYFRKKRREKDSFAICVRKKRRRRRWLRNWEFTPRSRFIKKRIYALLNKKQKLTRLLVNRIDPFLTRIRYTRIPKKVWINFLVLPYLMYLKRLLVTAISSKVGPSSRVNVLFFGMNQRCINASLIIEFIIRKLQQRHSRVGRLLYDALRILNRLVRAQNLGGYKLLMAGRFSRRDRATYVWKAYSSIPLSTKTSNVEYQYRYLQMRYSLGVLKLWINRL